MKNDEEYIKEVFEKYENSNKKSNYNLKSKIIKMAAMIVIAMATTVGIVYASSTIYQKIWKKPEEHSFSEIRKISEEEKNKSISKEDAIEKAKEIVENLEKNFGSITRAELNKVGNKPEWYIDTENKISVILNAQDGKLLSFSDWSIDDTKIPSTVSKSNAEKIMKEMYLKLGYSEGEYELSSLQKNGITDNTNIWQADFCKKYDGIFNIYQCVRISIIPEVNQLVMLSLFDYDFENNPIIITQDDATQIAKEKAVQLGNNKKITNIVTKLSIEKMNTFVYSLEQSIIENNKSENDKKTKDMNTDDFRTYTTDDVIRKVWTVEITYENDMFVEKDKYFVDCTTGEIIGGDSMK